MTKKMISWLSILTVFLTLFGSCHNEDFAKGETEPQRNNANFFKHVTSATAKSGIDYVSILEAYNREEDFLTTMPDQKGMPIWDKMQVLDIGEKTVLYVPLSEDKTDLSSLMVVKLDEENSVFHLQNFTNDYLEAYVYNTDYPKENRKLLMDTFLQMNFFTFGHQEFTNLPKDLYKGSTEYNRLNILDAKTETMQNKGFVYTTVCVQYHYCVHGQSISTCDYGHCTCGGSLTCSVTTSCTTTSTWVDDPIGSGFPSGGVFSGGGSGIPVEHTPDPCTQAKVFYRVTPQCAAGTGNTDILLDDPCEEIKAQRNDATFNNNIANLQGKITLKKETGYFQKNDGVFGYMDNATATDEANQLAMPDLNAYNYIKGYMHTHPNDYYYTDADGFTILKIGIKIFSPTDVIYFMKMVKNAKFTGKPLSGVYGIMVASMNNYQIRFTGNSTQIKEFTLEKELQLNKDFEYYMIKKLKKSKDLEVGFLSFLEEQMQITGVNLYRMNSDGSTTEIHLNADKTDTIENNCPI